MKYIEKSKKRTLERSTEFRIILNFKKLALSNPGVTFMSKGDKYFNHEMY